MGLEKTPEEYVEKMVKVFREVWRVLRDDGTLWLNMGDSYSSGGRDTYRSGVSDNKGHLIQNDMPRPGTPPDLKSKDLCGVPWRLAFALQADGWYLRSDIIWAKPNPMPESVSGCAWERHRIKVGNNSEGLKKRYETVREHGGATLPGVGHMVPVEWHDCPSCPKCEENDGYILSWNAGRPTKSHEYLFLFTKSPHYYFDAEAVREPHTRNWGNETMNWCTKGNWAEQAGRNDANRTNPPQLNPSGRNIRTVWNIATQPFSEAHFATFPEKLVEPCLKAGTSEKGVCPKCGGPWVRVIEGQGKYAEALQKNMEIWGIRKRKCETCRI